MNTSLRIASLVYFAYLCVTWHLSRSISEFKIPGTEVWPALKQMIVANEMLLVAISTPEGMMKNATANLATRAARSWSGHVCNPLTKNSQQNHGRSWQIEGWIHRTTSITWREHWSNLQNLQFHEIPGEAGVKSCLCQLVCEPKHREGTNNVKQICQTMSAANLQEVRHIQVM